MNAPCRKRHKSVLAMVSGEGSMWEHAGPRTCSTMEACHTCVGMPLSAMVT
jgi:hypothetical protein